MPLPQTSLPAHESTKLSIIGCGRVGMTLAYATLLQGLVDELVLHGRCRDPLLGEKLDLEHGMPYLPQAEITATEDYADLKDSDFIVITAGASQKPGETRLDLTEKNKKILESVLIPALDAAPNATVIIIANPVDVLTYHAYQITDKPWGSIVGSGTALDTARFRTALAETLHVSSKSIHAYILGEHGDASFPALSSATIGGQRLQSLPSYQHEEAEAAYHRTKNAAYEIIDKKGSTYYGIATVASAILHHMIRDDRVVLPLSIPLEDFHGVSDVALSVPCVVGRSGVLDTIEIKLSWDERERLHDAAKTLGSFL